MKLILGDLTPTSGQIRLQGSVDKVTPAELMAFVPQRSVMFTASVTANLLLNTEASSPQIRPLLEKLGLENMLRISIRFFSLHSYRRVNSGDSALPAPCFQIVRG